MRQGRMVQDGHRRPCVRGGLGGQPGQAGGVGRGDRAAVAVGQRAVAEDQPYSRQVPGPRVAGHRQPAAGHGRKGVDGAPHVVIAEDHLDRDRRLPQEIDGLVDLRRLPALGQIALDHQELRAPGFGLGDGGPGTPNGIGRQARGPRPGIVQTTERADPLLADVAVADGREPEQQPPRRRRQGGGGGHLDAGPAGTTQADVVGRPGFEPGDRHRPRAGGAARLRSPNHRPGQYHAGGGLPTSTRCPPTSMVIPGAGRQAQESCTARSSTGEHHRTEAHRREGLTVGRLSGGERPPSSPPGGRPAPR